MTALEALSASLDVLRWAARCALTTILLLCIGLPARALEIAPYFLAWGGGSLLHAQQTAGLNNAILAFGVTNGACLLDARLLRKLGEARAYVAAGGKLTISMGGADGVYAEIACSDSQLAGVLEMLMERAGTRRIDWDVEGQQLAHADGNARRARVLAALQAKYPDLYTSFTLTGRPSGLAPESQRLLRTTLAAGARIDLVNVMTMSFGSKNLARLNLSTMGHASIGSFRAAAEQVAELFPGKNRRELHAMMGITPMIGANDDDTTFTLTDAKRIADFVRDNGVGFISYWSFQRDKAQTGPGYLPLGTYSGVVQENQQFFRIFKTAHGPACAYPAWVQNKLYESGTVVAYSGRLYTATHSNPGFIPTVSTYYWSPYECPGTWMGLSGVVKGTS